jgi:flavodoxin
MDHFLKGNIVKILVLYYSKGGNTRSLAEAIGEGAGRVDGVEVVSRHTRDVKNGERPVGHE